MLENHTFVWTQQCYTITHFTRNPGNEVPSGGCGAAAVPVLAVVRQPRRVEGHPHHVAGGVTKK